MLARVRTELGAIDEAVKLLDTLEGELGLDWRIGWHRALAALASDDMDTAERLFDEMYSLLPGEAAPKLAWRTAGSAAATTWGRRSSTTWRGAPTTATSARRSASRARGWPRVREKPRSRSSTRSRTSPATTSRPRSRRWRPRSGAATPPSCASPSSYTPAGGWSTCGWTANDGDGSWPRCWRPVSSGYGPAAGPRAGACQAPLTERDLRRKLEETYRGLARLTDTHSERHALVRQANAARPRTLFDHGRTADATSDLPGLRRSGLPGRGVLRVVRSSPRRSRPDLHRLRFARPRRRLLRPLRAAPAGRRRPRRDRDVHRRRRERRRSAAQPQRGRDGDGRRGRRRRGGVVCDGVSSSSRPEDASSAASDTGVATLVELLAAGQTDEAATLAAVHRAGAAVAGVTGAATTVPKRGPGGGTQRVMPPGAQARPSRPPARTSPRSWAPRR